MADLQLRQLGSTGADVSELALGALTFGREADEADSAKILGAYLDAGGNFIDTADAYGRSEEVLAPLIKGIRDDVLIGSKVGLPSPHGPLRRANSEGTSRLRVLRQAERTLRRLGTEWIDVYYVHAWDPVTPLDETLSALDSLVRSGKVRYLGVSNFFGWQIAKAMGRATFHGYETVSLVTAEYSLVERGAEREIMSLCRHEKLALMPWGPLAGGMLTGKYTDEASFEGTRAGSGTNSTATVRGRLSSPAQPGDPPVRPRNLRPHREDAGAGGAELGAARAGRHGPRDRSPRPGATRREPRRSRLGAGSGRPPGPE